jgi:outer membrane protein assembly factor BamB
LKYSVIILILSLGFISCTKTSTNNSNPPPAPVPTLSPSYGILYYQTNGGLDAFDVDKGLYLWHISNLYSDNHEGTIYENGILYMGGAYGLCAVDSKTGQTIWNTLITTFGFTYGSPFLGDNRPVISDSLIYITAVNQSSAIADHPTLYCLNKTTGSIIWSHDLVGNVLSAAAVFTTPIVIKDKVIALAHCFDPVALANTVYCFDKVTGNPVWNNVSLFSGTADYLNSYPSTLDSTQIVFTSNDGNIVALDVNSGNLSWSGALSAATFGRAPIYDNGQMAFAGTGNFEVFDPASRQVAGSYTDTISSYAITGGNAFTLDNFYKLEAHAINNYNTPLWQWISPLRHLYDSLISNNINQDIGRSGNSYNSNITTDGEFIYYYENFFDKLYQWNPSREVNSLYMINVKDGTVAKEIHLTNYSYDSLLGRSLIVVKNNKPFYPIN